MVESIYHHGGIYLSLAISNKTLVVSVYHRMWITKTARLHPIVVYFYHRGNHKGGNSTMAYTTNDVSYHLRENRSYYIAKSNEIIQRARYDLSTTEIKVLSYVFSLIKQTDTEDKEYIFPIQTYCKIAGIDYRNTGNYDYIKKTLKALRDKSFWLLKEDGSETTIGWLRKVTINRGSGNIRVKLDEDVCKYLQGLKGNYYQYAFIHILPMTTSQSIILYELLKSYSYNHNRVDIEIDDLRKKLNCENKYPQFRDFKKRIDLYVKEINLYSDLEVSYEKIIKTGRKVTGITFYIKEKTNKERLTAWLNAEDRLDNKSQVEGQINLFDYDEEL